MEVNCSQFRSQAKFASFCRYGVVDVFDVEDLLELRNVNKVTKCLEQLSKLVRNPQRFSLLLLLQMYAFGRRLELLNTEAAFSVQNATLWVIV